VWRKYAYLSGIDILVVIGSLAHFVSNFNYEFNEKVS